MTSVAMLYITWTVHDNGFGIIMFVYFQIGKTAVLKCILIWNVYQ